MLLRFLLGALLATWVMACAIEPNPSPLTEGGPPNEESPGVDSSREPDKGGDGMGTTTSDEFETGGASDGGNGEPTSADVVEPEPDAAAVADDALDVEKDVSKAPGRDAIEEADAVELDTED
jgi:hypothetical protein